MVSALRIVRWVSRWALFLIPYLSVTIIAEDIIYPPGSMVFDVTAAPFFADSTGYHDATQAIQSAVDSAESNRGHGWGMTIVYVPNGTYRITGTIRWKEPPYTLGPHLIGQSRDKTILRLQDGVWPTKTEERRWV
ncbi:MAG: hypothetical protein GF344_01145, partial [Chitinivibrionales bacterium]|nr:hypothetical protein [Chitinivibrionales bacterium]MBD3355703.1 hypothetical protein [Chitinivibrionales bacterium]